MNLEHTEGGRRMYKMIIMRIRVPNLNQLNSLDVTFLTLDKIE